MTELDCKVWLKHLPKSEYDDLTDEDLDDDLSEPPLLLPDYVMKSAAVFGTI